ncbi:Hsp20/alpha crystallin family protein [Patescibacteria group bacterium]
MPIIKWNPFFMDEAFGDFFGSQPMAPALDIYEKDDKIIVEALLPEINPKKIEVDVDGGILTIKGAEEKKSEVDEKNYYRKEVRHGSFYRAVRLPVAVKEDKAEAKFKDGVLKISIPKAKETPVKKSVKIKVEEK